MTYSKDNIKFRQAAHKTMPLDFFVEFFANDL